MIRFDSKTRVVISEGLAETLRVLLEEEGVRYALFVVDDNVAEHGDVRSATALLGGKIDVFVHRITAQEPTTDIVNKHADTLRGRKADVIVGIGGGSTIDLAKALSVMLVNEGKVEDYHGTGKSFKRGIKKIMIPTTAGTGSEVTPGAVLMNKATMFKRAISGWHIRPEYALLDANLTMDTPDSITAFTGMDALAHAVESYTAKCANTITRMYSKEAFRLIYNALPAVFADRRNRLLRQDLLLGACLAGYAIYNSNTGACHSISYALGLYSGVPHGLAVGYLLSKVVKVNVEKGCRAYSDLYDLIEEVKMLDNDESKATVFSGLLESYAPLRYFDKTFRDYGISEEKIDFLAERGLDLAGALNNNPVQFGLKDSKRVLSECCREQNENLK